MSSRKRLPYPNTPNRLPTMEGPVDERLPVTVRLYLKPIRPITKSRMADAQGKTKFLTHDEFHKKCGAHSGRAEAVTNYLRKQGLAILEVDAAKRLIVAQGSAVQLSRIFGVELMHYRCGAHRFIGHEKESSVPVELRGIVQCVNGLDQRPIDDTYVRLRSRTQGDLLDRVGYRPEDVAKAYGFPAAYTGRGQCIGILALGGEYSAADLQTFLGREPALPPKIIDVGEQSASSSNADLELMMDVEIASAVAPGAQVVVYRARRTIGGLLDAFHAALNDRDNKPSIISISWGYAERAWPATTRQELDKQFVAAAKLGITVLTAAGDQGSSDGLSNGTTNVDFPASSPNATACGGTSLTIGADGTITEVVWDVDDATSATGGGYSNEFSRPAWQPKRSGGQTGRGVPDLAGHANPELGYRLRVGGVDRIAGGTSAVAPLMAGLVARINEARGAAGNLGFLNPTLYALPIDETFFPITQGDNGAFRAGTGWDPVSGLGRPLGEFLLKALLPPSK